MEVRAIVPDLDPDPDPDLATRRLLVFLGTAMIATGQPVHEVEDDVRAVGRVLGHREVQVAAAPTGIMLALASGAVATYESVNGTLRLDQGADVRLVRHQLMTGRIGPQQAVEVLLGLRAKASLYPRWAGRLGFVAIAAGIALILQPGAANVAAALLGGVLVAGVLELSARRPSLTPLVPTAAAFLVGLLVFAAADADLLDGALRTVLPPLAVLLPGALLVTGLSELAAGHMVAGSSRLLFGAVQLLLFALGLTLAAAVLDTPASLLGNVRVPGAGWWVAPLGLAVIVVGISALEGVRLPQVPWVALVLVLAFGAQLSGQQLGDPALGAFLGALAASLGATLVELARPALPRLVVFMPAFWLLVPGSLGLIGVSEVAIAPGQGSGTAFEVFSVVGGIALGLALGTTVTGTGRSLVRRWRPAAEQ